MALCTNAITMLRATLGDFGPTQIYSDERLNEALCVAAFFVVGDISLSGYTVNLTDFSVSPDLEGDELALVVLRAVCLLDGGAAREGARNSISVKDGPSSVDMRGRGNDLMRVGNPPAYCTNPQSEITG